MRPRSLSLLLLVCLALRLGAGPHPCHAKEAPAPAPTPVHASCHGSPAPAGDTEGKSEGKKGCCDPRTGDHSLCEQGCQRAAVLLVSLALPSVQPYEERTAAPEPGATPPLAFPIEHVPLG